MRHLVRMRRPLGSVTWGSAALRARGLGAITAAPISDEPYMPIRGGVDYPVPFEPGTIPPGQIPPGRICPSWGCATNGPTYPVGVFPINYIPITPPATVPTSDGTTPVTNPPTVVVTPTSGPIPTPAAVTAATAPATNPIADFLSGSLFLGIPNWALLLGAGAAIWALEGK